MPKELQTEIVQGQYFSWRVGPRSNRVFYADGRIQSNRVPLGRYSLDTKSHDEAIAAVRKLDLVMAVEHKLADESLLRQRPETFLPLEDGVRAYLDYAGRVDVAGGASKGTVKRYTSVFDKFVPFAKSQGVHNWQAVTQRVVLAYGQWLKDNDYAYRGRYLELTTIKQAVRYLINEAGLPASCRLNIRLNKAQGTETYCYTEAEVDGIIRHCQGDPELAWLGRLITLLAYTGMRIGEAVQLTWTDIDLSSNGGFIHVRDESRGGNPSKDRELRTTKTHQSRQIPVHREVKAMLEAMPGPHTGRVFHGPHGGALKPDRVRIALRRDVLRPLSTKFSKPTGIKSFVDGRVHSFRHFFCSYCYRSGVPEADIKLWLGHADSRMVAHYRHLAKGEGQRSIDKLKAVSEGGAAMT